MKVLTQRVVLVLSGDLWRAFPAAHAAVPRRHVHYTADRTLQTAAGVAASSRILDCHFIFMDIFYLFYFY